MLNSWVLKAQGGIPGYGLCLILLAFSLCGQHARAGKYAYGEQFVRVGQSWSDARPVRADEPAAQAVTGQQESVYREQLAALEQRDGPYGDALAEPLASLGQYYRQQGDLQQAMRLYRRALHVVRVNDGLYSERQMPILRQLLDAYRITGDLEALDGRYDYYYRLYGRGQPPYTEVRVSATLAYLRWQREAIRLGIEADETRRLLALYQLNEEQIRGLAADPEAELSWYRDLVLSHVRNLYLVEDRFAPAVESMSMTADMPMLANDWKEEDWNKRRLETLQRGSLSRGAELLLDLISRTAGEGDPVELARLHLELGDWYQWHGGDRRAADQYREVVKLLSEERRPDLLQSWLGQPVELPDNGAFWQPRPPRDPGAPVVVQVRYDVSARGRVSNMQSTVADPTHEGIASRIRRKLGQIRFRPRWDRGEAEPVAQVQREYQLMK